VIRPAVFALLTGAMATLLLAVWRAYALQLASRGSRTALQTRLFSQSPAALSAYRQVFTLLIFGSVSLLHAEAMVTTALGFSLSLAIGLFLLLKAFEHLFIPDMRRSRDYVDLSLSLVGATFYGWAVALADPVPVLTN
jgi:hypothetical protein